MEMPPLQLEQSLISRLRVDANGDHVPGSDDESQIETRVAISSVPTSSGRWHVQLEVQIVPSKDKPGPYEIEIKVHGFFLVHPTVPPAAVRQLLGVTGASILYSAAREHLLLVTGRGPWGALQLPTTSFAPDRSAAPDEIAEPTNQQAVPKRKARTSSSKAPVRR